MDVKISLLPLLGLSIFSLLSTFVFLKPVLKGKEKTVVASIISYNPLFVHFFQLSFALLLLNHVFNKPADVDNAHIYFTLALFIASFLFKADRYDPN